MFLVTQLVGIFIIKHYIFGLELPYGMQPPEVLEKNTSIFSIIISFIIAVGLFLLLIKIKAEKFIRLWFFFVTTIALGLTLNVFLYLINKINSSDLNNFIPYIALIIALPISYFKIYKRNLLIHNVSEILIYPGIAAVFVPLLNTLGIIILLLIISLYDIWAVWKSKFMQKMASYQINNLRFFTGFFVPYANKKEKEKIRLIKQKYEHKGENYLQKQFKKAKIKVNLAILGGGDVIFPIITAGIILRDFLNVFSSMIIILFATISIIWLLFFAKKGKFYPAMPFITIGIYLGMIFNWILIELNVI
jgi:presenilin-like A22 family membrane protease